MPYSDPAKQSAYQRAWMEKRRADWIQENGPCVDCGSWEEPEVDHADAKTKITHRVWSLSKARREAELVKCVVRCKSCHKKKSAGEKLRGEESGKAKLTEENVRMILASPNISLRVLAAQLKVDHSLVWQVRTRRIWKHIEGP